MPTSPVQARQCFLSLENVANLDTVNSAYKNVVCNNRRNGAAY